MLRGLSLLILALSCLQTYAEQPAAPPMPSYQMRAELVEGDRLHSVADAAALYSRHCGYCHLDNGMGTLVLMLRRLPMGFAPDTALLTHRDDLTRDYIRAIVRQGKGAMPRQTRVDITDSELERVAAFLARADSGASP